MEIDPIASYIVFPVQWVIPRAVAATNTPATAALSSISTATAEGSLPLNTASKIHSITESSLSE